MELKEFIKATIRDISDAVTELNEEMKEKGLQVNPMPDVVKKEADLMFDGRVIQEIDFHVSVTASERTDKGGGLKVYVANADLSSQSGHEATSSINFSIKVALPAAMG